MKVYILICEGCYDGEPQDTIVHAYATLERAREELKRAIREELAERTYFGDIYADPEQRDSIVIDESQNSGTALSLMRAKTAGRHTMTERTRATTYHTAL